jgi:predicted lipoprotein with Yx(FWY)xxD motif
MKQALSLLSVIAAGLISWACSGIDVTSKEIAPLQLRATDVGTVLVDPTGMTLYTYTDDPDGQSLCYGRCARKWVPVKAPDGAAPNGLLSVIERRDGGRQLAWRGKPLYTWVKDKTPGDVTGHKKGDVWFVARP